MRPRVFHVLIAGLALSLPLSASGDYTAGFVWSPATDFDDGTTQGANWFRGNPDDDAIDCPVWSYEWVQGGDQLGGTNPWYEQPPNLMVWDSVWMGVSTEDRWARADDTRPAIGKSPSAGSVFAVHWRQSSVFDFAPVTRWTNPTGDGVFITISGPIRVGWSGPGGTVDVCLAKVDSEADTTTVLWSATVNKPMGSDDVGLTIADDAMAGFDVTDVGMDACDQLVLSARARTSDSDPTAFIVLNFQDLEIELTGAPCNPPLCAGDINGDGIVDNTDLSLLLGNWNCGLPEE